MEKAAGSDDYRMKNSVLQIQGLPGSGLSGTITKAGRPATVKSRRFIFCQEDSLAGAATAVAFGCIMAGTAFPHAAMNISKLVNNEDFIPIRFLRVCHEFSFMVSLAGNPVFSGLTEVWSGVDLFRMRNGVCLLRRVYFRRIFSGAGKRRKAVFPMKNAAFPMVCRTV